MNIFLLRLDRIGDFVLGIPAYRALRSAYPNDRISVMVPSIAVELAKACPYFDEVYVFDALWLFPDQKPLERWKSALTLVRFLRSKNIDLLFDFRYQNRLDPLVAGLSGAKRRVGYDLGWVSRFLTQAVELPPAGLHQVERNLHLLQSLGIVSTDNGLEMWVSEHDRKVEESRIPAQKTLPGIPRIVVHVGAATPSKRWREESFSALLHELHATTQAELYVLGGENDLGFAHDVMDGLECPVVNLVGKLSLLEMAALTKSCDLFIGCDSGATHVAAASGAKVLCLFSAANEVEVWKPVGSQVKVLTRHPTCSPCRSHVCLRDDGYFCMAEIRVEEVVDEVKSMLAL